MSCKTAVKSLADGLVPLGIRLHEENQLRFSNSKHSHFIEQRNISFHNDISLKTMRLGVLSGEKLKNLETHGRIVSLDQLGIRRAIADLFVMFIP